MSVHNAASTKLFDQAVESVLSQSYGDLHLFVACDGPLSSSKECILTRIFGDRVTICRLPEQRGLPSALNHLIDVVLSDGTYKYIARMDADDISERERIALQIEFLEAHPEISILGTWGREIDLEGKIVHSKTLPTDHDSMVRFMALRSPLIHASVIMRSDLFGRGLRYDPKLLQAQDYDLWQRSLVEGAKMANLNQYLVQIRVDGDFYSRRSGFSRAVREMGMRCSHISHHRLWSCKNMFLLVAFFSLRVLPITVKRFAYRTFR